MLAVSIPNSATFSVFVDTATKCSATALSSFSESSNQSRAVRAFVSVSRVVKVLEQTTKSVSSGSRSRSDSWMSMPSTFETNRTVRSRSLKPFSAS